MSEIEPEWQGTGQHNSASDLSRWLVHLTRSEDDLISILKVGRIEARNAFGAGRLHMPSAHRSVCLTEIPLHELRRMTEKRPWGLVFDKERLRARASAQPVWYVKNPSPQWDAVSSAMGAARTDPDAPIWELTPFFDGVRPLGGRAPYDWRWEREWRVRGHLDFDLSEVALIVADEGGVPTIRSQVGVGGPMEPGRGPTIWWSGGFTAGWEAEVERLIGLFAEKFVAGDVAGVWWNEEAGAYTGLVEVLDTSDAMDDAFGHLAEELHGALLHVLTSRSDTWCRSWEIEQACWEIDL